MSLQFGFALEPLKRVRCASHEAFQREVRPMREPMVLVGFGDSWPARRTWTPNYLRTQLAEEMLNVYVSPDRYFPGEYIAPPDGVGKITDGRRTIRISGDNYFSLVDGEDDLKYYAHAVALPPTLEDDIPPLPKNASEAGSFLWLSSVGHVTPTHFDSSDNVLVQIYGNKTILLFDKCQFEKLYLNGVDHRYARHSQIFDLENIDFDRYPRTEGLSGFRADLGPGDALYIPNFWWHCAYTTACSASVNTWWNDIPFPHYSDLMEEWIDLRAKLFKAMPPEMPPRFRAYFIQFLLFSDLR